MGKFSSKEKYFKFVLYILIVVLVNIAGITLFFRADLTGNKIYSLSPASREVAATLSEPLSIKVFFSKDLPAPHNNTERYLKDLLEEYASKGGDLFNYTFYDVTPDEESLVQKSNENRSLARSYGISPVQIRIMENDEVKFKNAYMGLVIIHGDLIEKIEAVTSTDGLEYQLTTAIQKLNNKVSALHRLNEPVHVNLYLSPSLNQVAPLIGLNQLPTLGSRISEMVEKLNKKSLGVLEFKNIPIPDKATLDKLAEKYDLMSLSWPAVPGRNIQPGYGAAGLVMQYKDQSTTLPLIHVIEIPIIGTNYQMADPEALENELNLVMEKMIGINEDIGFVSSHGTLSLLPDQAALMQGRQTPSLQSFNNLISSRYTVKSIDLKDQDIPDGLNCLIIANPTEKFSDYELFKIDQALMKGTGIAFISDMFNQVNLPRGGMGMPPMFAPVDTGLEKLLAHYGVTIQKAYVMDKQCYKFQVPPNQGGGEQDLYFAPMIKGDRINNTPVFMDNIKGLVTMRISPVEPVKERIEAQNITAVKLLSSSDEAWLMEKSINLNPAMIFPPAEKEELKSYALAYELEGKFTSFFKGKPVPMKTSDAEEPENPEETKKSDKSEKKDTALKGLVAQNTVIETGKPAKIFILPSSQMIQDNMLDPEGRTTNSTFILNAIDHLNNQDEIAQLRAKQQTLNPLEETTASQRAVIKALNIIGLPVLVILFGMGVLIKRTARKKKLETRFNA